jgi:4-hydroxy-3-methylbut-2-enyl diphosphate reductase
MKVLRARVLGFCMGVRRAVDMAFAEAARGGRIFTMGPLIHNPGVLDNLAKQGITALDEAALRGPVDLSGAAVIIRAHGISPGLEAELGERGARIVDATCPRVKASQMKAASLWKEGYRIFLAGEERHGEIIGIQGYAPDCVVTGGAEAAASAAAELFREEPGARTALIGQTTISPAEYRETGEAIRNFFPDLMIVDTICGAVRDRQNALRELLEEADGVIVAGGRESSNTRRLLAIAGQIGKPCALVEGAGEIPAALFRCGTVGICAGASTPDDLIDGIEGALLNGCCRACPDGYKEC